MASGPSTEEEEWIESPDGWDDSGPTKAGHNQQQDAEEAVGFDFFGNGKDPKDSFTFELTVPTDDHTSTTTTTKSLELSGFKLDSEETAKSTGVTLWQAAPRLANYLMQAQAVKEHVQGRHVLELGAGLGLCGIVAFHLGASRVVLSDGDTKTLQQMRHNVKQNCDSNNTTTSSTIDCRQLIWGSPAQLAALQEDYGLFDTILGADVIYTRDSLDPLLDTVVALLKKPSGQFVLSRYTRWNDVSDEVVLEAAASRNLTCRQPDEGIYVFSIEQQ